MESAVPQEILLGFKGQARSNGGREWDGKWRKGRSLVGDRGGTRGDKELLLFSILLVQAKHCPVALHFIAD